MSKNISEFAEKTSLSNDDTFAAWSAADAAQKKVAFSTLHSELLSLGWAWRSISSSKYVMVPPVNEYTLAMTDTSDMKVGLPIKYAQGSATIRYAIVASVTDNANIKFFGEPFGLVNAVDQLWIGLPGLIREECFVFSGDFDAGAADLLDTHDTPAGTAGRAYKWIGPKAHFVGFDHKCKTADTGANGPKVNVKIDGNAVGTKNTNKGFEVTASWVAPADGDAVEINATNGVTEWGDAIEVALTEAGSNGDAEDLSVILIWVYE